MTTEYNNQSEREQIKTINKVFGAIVMLGMAISIFAVVAIITLLIVALAAPEIIKLYNEDEWLGILIVAIVTFGVLTFVLTIPITIILHYIKNKKYAFDDLTKPILLCSPLFGWVTGWAIGLLHSV